MAQDFNFTKDGDEITVTLDRGTDIIVLASGTITLTGGNTPAYSDNLGLALPQTKNLNVTLSPQDPSWDGDYAFNYDWGRTWNDSTSEMDVNITANWDVDPGGGKDLALDYKIIKIY